MICKYCGKECKNNNSLHNHERLCKQNPNHQESNFIKYNNDKSVKHSNRFIKAKEEGRKIIVSEETRNKLSKSFKGKHYSKETKNKISNSIKKYFEEHPDKIPFKLNHSSKKVIQKNILKNYLKKKIFHYNIINKLVDMN